MPMAAYVKVLPGPRSGQTATHPPERETSEQAGDDEVERGLCPLQPPEVADRLVDDALPVALVGEPRQAVVQGSGPGLHPGGPTPSSGARGRRQAVGEPGREC